MITLLCNISANKLRITLLCREIIWRYKYICNIFFRHKMKAEHNSNEKCQFLADLFFINI